MLVCYFLCLETKKVTKENSRKTPMPPAAFSGLRLSKVY
jgi:hypothetical protein